MLTILNQLKTWLKSSPVSEPINEVETEEQKLAHSKYRAMLDDYVGHRNKEAAEKAKFFMKDSTGLNLDQIADVEHIYKRTGAANIA